MTKFRVGVCELPSQLTPESNAWTQLRETASRQAPHLLLVNEMPFGPWIAAGEAFDDGEWNASCAAHDAGVARLSELGAHFVASSRPIRSAGRCVNEAFIASSSRGLEPVHTKQYFPDEEGYYEARWFQAGERHFRAGQAGELSCGFLICTEVMFNERARQYGRSGAHVILVPRASGTSIDRWLVAMRMAAIVSGCYVMSSNRAGVTASGQAFGGTGWIIDPIGNVVAQTTPSSPVVFADIDTELVAKAQSDYPCYVKE
jgi:N-carbamoylputrescine amidase